MSRGHPDWQTNVAQYSFGDIDTAELAVRLLSPSIWRRSGRVIFLDDFERGMVSYIVDAGGLGAAVAIDSTVSDTGLSCLKFTPGSNGTMLAGIEKHIPYLANSRFGFEGSFWLTSGVDSIEIRTNKITGTDRQGGHIRVDAENKELLYRTDPGAWVKIDDIHDVYDVNPTFFNVKVVVDFDANEYVRAYLNETEYDLSGITLRTTVIGGDLKYLAVAVLMFDDSGGQDVAYAGSLIATIDEP